MGDQKVLIVKLVCMMMSIVCFILTIMEEWNDMMHIVFGGITIIYIIIFCNLFGDNFDVYLNVLWAMHAFAFFVGCTFRLLLTFIHRENDNTETLVGAMCAATGATFFCIDAIITSQGSTYR